MTSCSLAGAESVLRARINEEVLHRGVIILEPAQQPTSTPTSNWRPEVSFCCLATVFEGTLRRRARCAHRAQRD